ncbi:hypothetical protein [Bordetella sp. LUAb4]|uniref:hypothetical protein n=1 Tax=Bordetella sp. LUAb4 TaxID=2843195 RepID=UPI001E5C21D3|nr:hypothetical protein [Bordetella sp. LUAb4]
MSSIGISTYKDAAVFHIVEPLSSKDLNRVYGIRRVSHGKLARASLKRLQALRHDVLTLGKKSFKAINKVTSMSRAREAGEYKIQDNSTKREWVKDGKLMRRQFRQETKGIQRERVEQQHTATRKFVVSAILQHLASDEHGSTLGRLAGEENSPVMKIDARELQQYRGYAHVKGHDALLALFKQDVTDALKKDLKQAAVSGDAPLASSILASRPAGAAGTASKSFENVVYQAALAATNAAAYDLTLKLGELNLPMHRNATLTHSLPVARFANPSLAAAAA